MRKITDDAANAFINGHKFSGGNTAVTVNDGVCELHLHGNTIARKTGNAVSVCDAYWRTNTTKERINGVLEFYGKRVNQVAGVWYLKDKATGVETLWVNSEWNVITTN